jgi:hypothetical protein
VFGGVREGFRHDVIRSNLDPLRHPAIDAHVELDRDGRAAGEHPERGG